MFRVTWPGSMRPGMNVRQRSSSLCLVVSRLSRCMFGGVMLMMFAMLVQTTGVSPVPFCSTVPLAINSLMVSLPLLYQIEVQAVPGPVGVVKTEECRAVPGCDDEQPRQGRVFVQGLPDGVGLRLCGAGGAGGASDEHLQAWAGWSAGVVRHEGWEACLVDQRDLWRGEGVLPAAEQDRKSVV